MPAAHFLFAALQVVSDCRTSRRQAPVCRTQSDRGQKEMYRVRHVLCIYFKQRQILPGLPEADYPQTGSRAHEEKTRSCYAVGAKKALFYAALTAVLKGGNILIPIPLKSRFYCVTKNNGFIENLVVFYLENSGHKITLYTKRWFALANHFFLCYNIFRYFSIFGGFLLTLNQYLL